jgi:hypothetical protein
MITVQSICTWNIFCVPAVITSLGSAEQQNDIASRIERINHAIRFAGVLDP